MTPSDGFEPIGREDRWKVVRDVDEGTPVDAHRQPHEPLSRRGLLLTGAGTVVAGTALASCGGDGGPAGAGQADPYGAPQPKDGPGDGPGGQTGASPPPEGLVALDEVPVGGAVVVGDEERPVVVAQPSAGEVVAFSAVCTHKGCTVAAEEKILRCPCHGSTFDPVTGENTGGPAPSPLPGVPVRVEDGMVIG